MGDTSGWVAPGFEHVRDVFEAGFSGGWADPAAELTFGFVTNRMEMGLTGDARGGTLIDACYASL